MSDRIAGPAWLMLAVLSCGCGQRTGSLAGEVRYEGKPVVVGVVTVVDADGFPHAARIEGDGRYKINDIPTGTVKIAVTSPDPRGDADNPPSPGDGAQLPMVSGWRAIPNHYADVATSGLMFELKPGSNTFNIELTGKAP